MMIDQDDYRDDPTIRHDDPIIRHNDPTMRHAIKMVVDGQSKECTSDGLN